MPDVPIHGIGVLFGDGNVQPVRLCVVYLLVARLDVPNAPGRYYLHVGRERFYRKLETHLIVALARAAVADSVGFFALGYFDEAFCYDGTRERRAQKVLALVHRVGFYRREYAVADKLFGKVLDEYLLRAALDRFFVERGEFLALTDVGGDGDHVAVVVILEPRYDYRGIETARVGENDLHFCHYVCSFAFVAAVIFYIIYYPRQIRNRKGSEI